jgi:peptide/nickel transport system permease protein
MSGMIVVACVVTLGLLAPVLNHYDPTATDFNGILRPPTLHHPFGTDNFGRDVLARVLYGYRVSTAAAVFSVAGAVAAGVPLGLTAGYFGRIVDTLIMRPLDLLMAFPALFLAVALVAVFGTSLAVVILALSIIYLPIMTRVLRGSVLTVTTEEYVEAARALGASPRRIMVHHILPNALSPLIVQASISMGIAILIEAALSFIGLGTQPPDPSLGLMLAEGRDFMHEAPWMVTFPGLAIVLAVLGFNLLGDGLREVVDRVILS